MCRIRSSCDRTGFYAKIQNNFWQLRVWGKDYKYCWTISYATFASQTWTQFRHKISFFAKVYFKLSLFWTLFHDYYKSSSKLQQANKD